MKNMESALEDRIRRAFALDDPNGRPRDDFHHLVLSQLSQRGRRRLPAFVASTLRAVFATGLAVAVGAIVVVAPLANRQTAAPSSPVGTTPVQATAQTPLPTRSAAPLAHGKMWDLEFDYPASWVLAGGNQPTTFYGSSMMALGSVGTSEVLETCAYPSPQPGFSGHLDQTCRTTWDRTAEVQVRFEWDSRDSAWSAWKATTGEAPADHGVTVAGLPARMAVSSTSRVPGSDEVIPDAHEIVVWDVASRNRMWWSFRVTAVIRGPNAAAARAQVDAMMASATYQPSVEPLVDNEQARAGALQAGIAMIRDQADGSSPAMNGRPARKDNPDMSAACFSDVPGATSEAVITGTVFIAHRLTQPLRVRCTSQIEATPFQMWKMTLRYDWEASDDHPAGSASLVVLLAPDLVSRFGGDSYGLEEMPYLQAVPSNGPPG